MTPGLFLAYYAAYVLYLILAASQHATLPEYSGAMLGFVLPLTAVTLIVLRAPGCQGRDHRDNFIAQRVSRP